jgi:5'-3' exonuclease
MTRNVGLIDGDIFVYPIAYACKNEDNWESVKSTVISKITEALDAVNTTAYVGFLTSETSFRKELTAQESIAKIMKPYKGNRPDEKPRWHSEICSFLEREWGFTKMQGYEADDLVASYAYHLKQLDITYVVISTDKDLLQIPGRHYNPVSKLYRIIDGEQAPK